MWIFLIIVGIVVIVLIRGASRQNGYYQVVDNNNQVRTTGKYNQCKQWIEATKQMESLSGVYNSYRIKKMKL